MKKITIGARGSKLSLAYVKRVKNLILQTSKNIGIETKTIKTSGDIHKDKKLSEIGGKNLFCKEIEENLLENNIDIALHSLKDMESVEHNDLIIGAYIERNDHRDILIGSKIKKITDLKKRIIIGSSSKRRELQLKKISRNIDVVNIRGNVDTRIKKLEDKEFDAIILAAAGVKSLNLKNKISLFFKTSEILPAVGQGIVALQCRKNDKLTLDIINKINDKDSSLCAIAERTMLKTIGGDCETAVGGFAKITNNILKLQAQLFSDDGKNCYNFEFSGRGDEAVKIGKKVGIKLLSLAGDKYKKK